MKILGLFTIFFIAPQARFGLYASSGCFFDRPLNNGILEHEQYRYKTNHGVEKSYSNDSRRNFSMPMPLANEKA